MFEVRPSFIPGCRELRPSVKHDPRGRFVKTFHAEFFASHGMATDFVEQYYTVSGRRVLRGLHFQVPPHHHAKLICCVAGAIVDVVLDLRVGSPTYGCHDVFRLEGESANQIYVPRGLAHGFCVTSKESATVLYNQTTMYSPEHDRGLLWNSAGIAWPEEPFVISDRDRGFPSFAEFSSPFRFEAAEA